MRATTTRRCLLQSLTAVLLSIPATGQCDPVAVSTGVFPGANGYVADFCYWDPDGAGPLGEHVVVAGDFTMLFGDEAAGLGLFEPNSETWQAWSSVDGRVFDAAVTPDNDLIIVGEFTAVDGIAAHNIARFDGTSWSPVAGGIPDGHLDAVEIQANGDIFVGGKFTVTFPTGAVAGGIARFDGSVWWSMGNATSPVGGSVAALATMPDGSLIAAGAFTHFDAVAANSIARWDGTGWSPLGNGIGGTPFTAVGSVNELLLLADGRLLAGGQFSVAGTHQAKSAALWDGSDWQDLAANWDLYDSQCYSLLQLPNGDVIFGGVFRYGLALAYCVRWSAGTFTPMEFQRGGSTALIELPSGDILGAGNTLSRWDSITWNDLATGTNGPVRGAVALDDGRYFVGGRLSTFAGVQTTHAALFENGQWNSLDPTSGAYYWSAPLVDELPDGRLIAILQSNNSYDVMRVYDDGNWTNIASFDGNVQATTVDANSNLIVGGEFTAGPNGLWIAGLRRYDGTNWTAVDPDFDGTVSALALLPDGRLAVGGNLSTTTTGAFGKIATWDGSTWSVLGGDLGGEPRALATLLDGTLVAAGNLVTAGGLPVDGLAQWNGTNWQPMGTGIASDNASGPTCLSAQPDGELLVGGDFTSAGGIPANHIARWDGAQWHAIGTGASAPVTSIDTAADGRTILTGDFASFDGVPSAYAAIIEPPCGASVAIAEQSQCYFADVEVEQFPFIGTAVRTATSIYQSQTVLFPLALIGTNSAFVPLHVLFDGNTFGCRLLVTPDVIELLPVHNGRAEFTADIPLNTSLVGQPLFHQFMILDTNAAGAIDFVRTSAQVTMTIGTLW